MSTWGLIPVKDFNEAKSRLASVLSSAKRRDLARSLFHGVANALIHCSSIDRVAALTDSAEVAEYAESLGMITLRDHPGANLAGIIDIAVADLSLRGAARVLICMADLPWLTSKDCDEMLLQLGSVQVVLAPDLSRQGTNALAVQPPGCLRTCFGNRDSLIRHQRAAEDLALTTRLCFNEGLGFDVDEPGDLKRLRML